MSTKAIWQRDPKEHSHKHPLPKAICNAIRPTFDALTTNKLFERCLHDSIQNSNESLNALAVFQLNDGATSTSDMLAECNIISGIDCRETLQSIDHERVNDAKIKSSEKAKERRKAIRNREKGFAEKFAEEEGPSYEAGLF